MRFVDMHQDLAFSSMKANVVSGPGQSSISALREYESCIIFGSIFPHIPDITDKVGIYGLSTKPSRDLLISQMIFYGNLCRKESLGHVRRASDLDSQGVNLLMALEGTDSLISLDDIDLLYSMGVRSLGLTWNYDTKFAASCHSSKDYGLTGSGGNMVDECNRRGMVVDLAHSSRNTILDTCSITSRPVVFSHGNVSSVDTNIRNIDDDCIDAVVSTGGIIGITAIPQTLGKEPSIDRMIKHASYVGENYGWDHVALGTDFLGIENTPSGFEDVSRIPHLRDMLGKHAEAVMWENGIRVLRQILA